MKTLLYIYNELVKDNLIRMVPKTIMALFINEVIKETEGELMKEILKEGNSQYLIKADPAKLAQAQQLEKELDNLQETLRALDRL